ncbi:MAG: hypothetical protein KME25_19340 [Symplocastrum torsivum CPER-KK1]|jgi:hypothetical protein|uniref:Uncharacterized protein n=1 Tax=Symplocastrum torsivum CPER-KK1 TaxID=450513 RepID=A0A951PMY1_9CYAN|nr:hypothetical protein [Symplocastrum torsivum CPER-KK1]
MNEQEIIEQFPELMPYLPQIVDGKIEVSVTRRQSKEFAHNVRELCRRAFDLGLQGIRVKALGIDTGASVYPKEE